MEIKIKSDTVRTLINEIKALQKKIDKKQSVECAMQGQITVLQ